MKTTILGILKTQFPIIKIYYQSEEPGCSVYVKNDIIGKYFPDTEIDGIPFTIMTEEREEELTCFIRGIKNGENTFQVHKQEDC